MDKIISEKKDRGLQVKHQEHFNIGIIGAMEEEVAQLIQIMEDVTLTKKAGMKFHKGILEGVSCVVVQSGIGKVNAGICAQILVDLFSVTHIMNTGIAGSLDANIDIGDIVIGDELVYHDVDATEFGYPLGEIPRLNKLVFEADEYLVRVALTLKPYFTDITLRSGRIVSGDQFVASKEMKDKIKVNFNGLATEMEGAAIAHVAFLNQIPFLVIRAISDKADDSASVDYPTFEKKAIAHSVLLVRELLKRIAF